MFQEMLLKEKEKLNQKSKTIPCTMRMREGEGSKM